MEELYKAECTRDWVVESDTGRIKLLGYFDTVDWRSGYAIEIDGEIKATLDGDLSCALKVYDVVLKCVK